MCNFEGDVLFSCLGTTRKDAGSQAAQRKIDYGYQYAFARIAKQNRVPRYVLVSANGANPQSRIFYSRMKGELECAVMALGFARCVIARPSLLHRPNSRRTGENLGVRLLTALTAWACSANIVPCPPINWRKP